MGHSTYSLQHVLGIPNQGLDVLSRPGTSPRSKCWLAPSTTHDLTRQLPCSSLRSGPQTLVICWSFHFGVYSLCSYPRLTLKRFPNKCECQSLPVASFVDTCDMPQNATHVLAFTVSRVCQQQPCDWDVPDIQPWEVATNKYPQKLLLSAL